jgi:signal peptide peptidase SppA
MKVNSGSAKRPARRVLAALHTAHWAMTREMLDVMLSIASRANPSIEAIEAKLGRPLENTYTVSLRDGVATIPIIGPMFRYADLFSAISGATAYATIATDFIAARDNPEVKAIILEIDSPGGEVNGLVELGEMIAQSRGSKPVIAYVSGQSCSAAYLLAASAERIVIASSAMLGSIGAVLCLTDTRERDRREGVAKYEIVSSQSPKKRLDPASAEGRSEVQTLVDSLAQVYIEAIATFRGITADQVIANYGGGGVFIGEAAVQAGLADELGNYEGVLAQCAATADKPAAPLRIAASQSVSSKENSMKVRQSGAPGATADPAILAATLTAPVATLIEGGPTGDANSTGTLVLTAPASEPAVKASAFDNGTRVKATVTREVTLTEGAEGEIQAVREGAFYSVAFSGGTYLWLAEDELAALEAETDGETPEASPPAAIARTAQQLRAEGAARERARILAIQGLARPAEASLALECINDSECTAEAAALRFRNAEKATATGKLNSIVGDERKLTAPTPLLEGSTTPTAAQQVLASFAKVSGGQKR